MKQVSKLKKMFSKKDTDEVIRKEKMRNLLKVKKETYRARCDLRKQFCKEHGRFPTLTEAVELLDNANLYTKESNAYYKALQRLTWTREGEARAAYQVMFLPETINPENEEVEEEDAEMDLTQYMQENGINIGSDPNI
jgi:hypothetical protein